MFAPARGSPKRNKAAWILSLPYSVNPSSRGPPESSQRDSNGTITPSSGAPLRGHGCRAAYSRTMGASLHVFRPQANPFQPKMLGLFSDGSLAFRLSHSILERTSIARGLQLRQPLLERANLPLHRCRLPSGEDYLALTALRRSYCPPLSSQPSVRAWKHRSAIDTTSLMKMA